MTSRIQKRPNHPSPPSEWAAWEGCSRKRGIPPSPFRTFVREYLIPGAVGTFGGCLVLMGYAASFIVAWPVVA
jgi:hypothetical protein